MIGIGDISLPAIAGTTRDPQRTCTACEGRRFQIKSGGPGQAWLKCLECGKRQLPPPPVNDDRGHP